MKPTQEQILRALNKLVRENKTELKAEKIELGLTDDVEKLTQQAKALIPDLTRDIEGIKTSEKNVVIGNKLLDKQESIVENADKKERELFRALESAQDNLTTAKREFTGTKGSLENDKKNIEFLSKRLGKTKSQASKVKSNLANKLSALEKAAKDLGVKIPTGDASKILNKLISLL